MISINLGQVDLDQPSSISRVVMTWTQASCQRQRRYSPRLNSSSGDSAPYLEAGGVYVIIFVALPLVVVEMFIVVSLFVIVMSFV